MTGVIFERSASQKWNWGKIEAMGVMENYAKIEGKGPALRKEKFRIQVRKQHLQAVKGCNVFNTGRGKRWPPSQES